MGDKVSIQEIQYLYANSDNPLWQIDFLIERTNGEVLCERLFVKPEELDALLGKAKELAALEGK